MRNILIVISSIALIVIYSSCEKPERKELTKEEKALVDSLYSKQVGYERKICDSICDATYQSIFDAAKDSFYYEYVKEIQAIIND